MLYNDIARDPEMTWPSFYYLNFSLYGCGYMFKETNLMTRLYEHLFWESTIEVYFPLFCLLEETTNPNAIITQMPQITTWNI